MPPSTRRRALINLAGVALATGLVILAGAALVPFMLERLGKDDYGLFQLVRSFLGYLPLLTLALAPALSRYVIYAHGQKDRTAISRYMSTGLTVMLGLSGVLWLAGSLLALFLPRLLDLGPHGRQTQILLALMAATVAISQLVEVFNIPLFARERIAEATAVSSMSPLLRALGIVAAFYLLGPSLVWVGAAALAGALVSGAVAVVWAFRVFPWMKLSRTLVERTAVRDLMSFGLFATVSGLTSAIYYSTDNLIIRWLYGTSGTALITVYSIGATWDPWIRSFFTPLVNVILPRMTLLAAQDLGEEMRRLVLVAIRYSTALVAPVCIFVSLLAEPILVLWLGDRLTADEFATAAAIMPIFLISLLVAMGMFPTTTVFVARAKLAMPTFVALLGGLVNLVLSVILARDAGWGLLGIAAATGITTTLRVILFVPFYLRRVAGLPVLELFRRGLLPPWLLAGAYGMGCWWMREVTQPVTFTGLALLFLACLIPYTLLAYFLVALPEDRQRLRQALRRFRRNA